MANHKNFFFTNLFVVCMIFIIVIVMSVGFALFDETLLSTGIVTVTGVKTEGKVEITNMVVGSSTNVNAAGTLNFQDMTAEITGLGIRKNGVITYSVTLTNDTYDDIAFKGYNFISSSNYYFEAVSGIELGDIIAPGESKTFSASISSTMNLTNQSASFTFQTTTSTSGVIEGNVSTREIDLVSQNNQKIGKIDATLVSSYEFGKIVSFAVSDENFELVNAIGEPLGNKSVSNGTNNVEFYIKPKAGIEFYETPRSMHIYVLYNDIKKSIGTIDVSVYIAAVIEDDEPPIITSVTISQAAEEGKLTVNWETANTPGVPIDGYYIIIYKEGTTDSDVALLYSSGDVNREYTMGVYDDVLSAGNYYAVVYGVDQLNSGMDYLDQMPNTPYAKRSSTVSMQWIYNIEFRSNLSISGFASVPKGGNYSATISGNKLPNGITVTQNGVALGTNANAATYYTYDKKTGRVMVYNVQGNLVINA